MNKYVIIFMFSMFCIACDFDDQTDPNNPSVPVTLANANIAQLNNLVTGTLSQMRPEINNFYDETGVIGREIYRISGSDPRWTSDLLSGVLDNNAFYTTRSWGDRYQTIKNANLLIQAVNNTAVVSELDVAGYTGFAKTIQANELLILLMQQYEQVRIDVVDPDNLGPLVSRQEGLNYIISLLNEAQSELNSAGESFPFTLTSGFDVLDFPDDIETEVDMTVDPDEFLTFNRALLARALAYTSDWPRILAELPNTFINVAGEMTSGPVYSFSLGAGDQTNPVFLPLNNTGENRLAHPSFLSDILAGDQRANKVSLRDEDPGPVIDSELTGTHDISIYATNTSSIPIIKKEELILLRAEANIQLGNMTDAVNDFDKIRSAYGLGAYSGGTDMASLLNELLYQRRYSLYFEGHRWNDLLRYNRTSDLPLDRPGDLIHTSFPVPFDDANI